MNSISFLDDIEWHMKACRHSITYVKQQRVKGAEIQDNSNNTENSWEVQAVLLKVHRLNRVEIKYCLHAWHSESLKKHNIL